MVLSKFLNLAARNKKLLDEYAEKLYQVCSGHPRTIAEILLKRCIRIEGSDVPPAKRPEYVSENEDTLDSSALELLEETALKFSNSTRRLLKECGKNKADLKLADEVDGFTYEHLLPPLRIGVKEFVNGSIQLRVPDRIRMFLEALVSPLFDYIKLFESRNTVPINFPFAIELLIAKVVIHWFQTKSMTESAIKKTEKNSMNASKSNPGKSNASLAKKNEANAPPKTPKEINDFFFNTRIFGGWESFACDNNIKGFPKVTSSAKTGESEFTVLPEEAKNKVSEAFLTLPPSGLWLLPRPMSSSPDLIYISQNSNGQKRIVCVAAKNYNFGSTLGENGINSEIEKATRMIPDDTDSSVLVVACTNYTGEVLERFEGKGYHVHPYSADNDDRKIDEVILLNLSSPELRAKLCGKNNAEGLHGFEILVSKTQVHYGFNIC